MKTFINILTLFVFTIGTFQFSSIVSFCRMMEQDEPMVVCACCEDLGKGEVTLSSDKKTLCCSIEKFDKDKVQDFTTLKDEILKIISFQPSLKNLAIFPKFFSPSEHPTFSILRIKLKIPILNSSLLI